MLDAGDEKKAASILLIEPGYGGECTKMGLVRRKKREMTRLEMAPVVCFV